jgi:hypothetical protein
VQIIAQFDSSVSNAPAGYMTAVQAAIDFFDQTIVNPITVTLTFSYGELNGQAMSSGALGESSTNGNIEPYSQLVGQLTAAATSQADFQSLAALPASDPTGGGSFWVSDTEAKIFGVGSLPGFTDPQDGFVALASRYNFTFDPNNRSAPGLYDAVGVIEHEISEAIGRISYLGDSSYHGHTLYSPLDLFRYSGPGVHQLSPGSGIFSVNGVDMLFAYNDPSSGADAGDWNAAVHGDSFGFGQAGVAGIVSPTDLLELDVLGFQIASPLAVIVVTDAPSSVVLRAGSTETITLTLDQAVTVTGSPILTLNDGGTATYLGGSGSSALNFSYTVGLQDVSVPQLAVIGVNLNGGVITVIGAGPGIPSLSGVSQPGPQVQGIADFLASAFTNVMIAGPTSALATSPTITLGDGSSVTNPIYTFAQSLPGLATAVSGGQTTLAVALNTVEHDADASTTVATIAYEFFTGATPTSAGYGFLVNGTSNPNDLDSAYYAQFNEQNRFINFASNLGKVGAGEAAFSAAYGSLDLTAAMTKAYTAIFGFAPAAGKIASLLSAQVTPGETRADYFAFYGQDGLNGLGTKAAAIGWLMTVAVQADLGVYAAANDGFLSALATGAGAFNVDLLAAYPTMTASQAAAMQAQVVAGASIVSPLQVADLAANVVAGLDQLQALAASNKLGAIALTDAATPTLNLTAPQAGADSGALALISSAYAIAVTGTAAQTNGETIAHFTTSGSSLDLTDLNHAASTFSAVFAENAAGTQGTLTVTDGAHSASVTLIGHLAAGGFSGSAAAAGFTFTADTGAGTLIGWHA